MPKANHKSNKPVFSEDETSYAQESDMEEMGFRSSQASTSGVHDSDSDQEVTIKAPVQVPTSMYVPCIEGPKMNWTVDDGLYNRFVKWKTKMQKHLRLWVGHVVRAKKV